MNSGMQGGLRNYDEFDEDFDDEFDEDFDDTFEEDFEEDFNKADFNRDDDPEEDMDEETALKRFGAFMTDDEEEPVSPSDELGDSKSDLEETEDQFVAVNSDPVEELPDDDDLLEEDPEEFVNDDLLDDDEFDEEF